MFTSCTAFCWRFKTVSAPLQKTFELQIKAIQPYTKSFNFDITVISILYPRNINDAGADRNL